MSHDFRFLGMCDTFYIGDELRENLINWKRERKWLQEVEEEKKNCMGGNQEKRYNSPPFHLVIFSGTAGNKRNLLLWALRICANKLLQVEVNRY